MHRNMRAMVIVGGMLAASVAATSAQGAYIKSYDANSVTPAADPTTAAGGSWTLGGTNNAVVTKAAGSGSEGNFWHVTDTNTPSNNSVIYSVTNADAGFLSALTDADGWKASVRLKVLQSAVAGAAANTAPTWIDIRTDANPSSTAAEGRIFAFGFLNDPASPATEGVYFAPNGSAMDVANPIALMDLDGAFHQFDIVYTPAGAGSAVRLYIDGATTPAFTILESSANTSTVGRFQWGSAASGATQDVQWQVASFAAPVPEPSSLGGLCAAGLSLLLRRRRPTLS